MSDNYQTDLPTRKYEWGLVRCVGELASVDAVHLKGLKTYRSFAREAIMLLQILHRGRSVSEQLKALDLLERLCQLYIDGYGFDFDVDETIWAVTSHLFTDEQIENSDWPSNVDIHPTTLRAMCFYARVENLEEDDRRQNRYSVARNLWVGCAAARKLHNEISPFFDMGYFRDQVLCSVQFWRRKLGKALSVMNWVDDVFNPISTIEAPTRVSSPLMPNDRHILIAMVQLGATGNASPIASGEILSRAGVPESGTVWDNLRLNGLVDAKAGVGRWLTGRGFTIAKNLYTSNGLSPS
ncbi:hypothetical protein [Rhodopirellula sallentina]|uniref:Uncharacterized protein n=1 Tax=Rhodopirellula sallentina SM41 TaxID=1263870 RepID=M5TZL3_9BACT|nr:hypothetical protein [Rhodopirellula sallentina]EMI54647.1 hypothetical protein RSSM_03909 [Rhodopirellula sallentina SM41]